MDMYTWRVKVAFEGRRVGETFVSEETIRLRMLAARGYVEIVDGVAAEEPAPAAAPRRGRSRARTVMTDTVDAITEGVAALGAAVLDD